MLSVNRVRGFLEADGGAVVGRPFGASFIPVWNQPEMGVSLEVPMILVFFIGALGKDKKVFRGPQKTREARSEKMHLGLQVSGVGEDEM